MWSRKSQGPESRDSPSSRSFSSSGHPITPDQAVRNGVVISPESTEKMPLPPPRKRDVLKALTVEQQRLAQLLAAKKQKTAAKIGHVPGSLSHCKVM